MIQTTFGLKDSKLKDISYAKEGYKKRKLKLPLFIGKLCVDDEDI